MKWITHQTGAFLGGLMLGMPWPGIAAAGLGAVFPDIIDQKISGLGATRKKRQKIFNQIHRGSSHWIGWWFPLFLLALSLPLPALARDAAAGFTFGAVSHVMLDMLTPQGVPVWPFSRQGKISVPLCATGKAGEYVFLLVMLACGAFWFQDAIKLLLPAILRYL